jgi:hypothetical protein
VPVKRARKAASDTVQTAVRLPRRLLEQLRQSEYGITDGIIRAVTQMFVNEHLDWQTRELIAAISQWQYEVKRETGSPWHGHAGSHEVLRRAILMKLARMRPEGPTEFGDRPHKLIQSDDPNVIAQALEYLEFQMQDPVRQARVRKAMDDSEREMIQQHSDQQKDGDKS